MGFMADTPNVSTAEKLLGHFLDEKHPTQDLLQELRKITGPDRPGILSTVRDGLKNLNAEQRKIADENMKLLRERVEANAQEKAIDQQEGIPEQEVTQLRVELDALEMEVAPPPEAKKSETLLDPTSWSPEHQQQARDIAIVGAVVVGGAILFSKLSGKAKGVFGKIKMAIAMGVAGFLGYFGLKAHREIQAAKEEIEEAKKLLEKGRKTIEQTKSDAEKLIADAKNRAPDVKDQAEDAAEVLKYNMLARGLLIFNDQSKSEAGVGDQEIDQDGVAKALRELRGKKLDDIENVATPDKSTPQIDAGYHFAKLVASDWLEKHPEQKDRTLGDVIQPMRASMRILANAADIAKKGGSIIPSPQEWQQDLQSLFSGVMEEFKENADAYDTALNALNVPKKDRVAFLSYCATHKDDPLKGSHEKFTPVLTQLSQRFSTDGEWVEHLAQYGHLEKFKNVLNAAGGNLSIGEALQLHLLLQSVPKEKETGKYSSVPDTDPHIAFGLQMLAMSMVGRRDEELSEEMKVMLLVKGVSQVGQLSADKIEDINLPPESWQLLSKTSGFIMKGFWDRLKHLGNLSYYGLNYAYQEAPVPTSVLATTAGLYAAPKIMRGVQRVVGALEHNAIDRFASAAEGRVLSSRAAKYGITYTEAQKVKDAAQAFNNAKGINSPLRLVPGYGIIDELKGTRATALRTFRETLKNAKAASRAPVAPWQKAMLRTALVAQAAGTYADIQEYREQGEQRKAIDKHANESLSDLQKQFGDPKIYENLGNNKYKHKGSGVEVTLKQTQREMKGASTVLDAHENAQFARMTSSGGFLVLTACLGAARIAGPVGLVVAGTEVVVRMGINAWEQGKVRAFLKDCPPWVLVTLGAQGLTNMSEYDLITKASGWMLSDLYPSLDDKDKPEIRKKMLFALFCSDLQRYAPEAAAEIMAGMQSGPVLDAFYANDFEKIVLPLLSVQLFQAAKNGGVSWEAFQGGDIDSGAILSSPDLSLVETRQAMRESTILYLQHVREKRFLEHVASLKKSASEEGEIDELLLEVTEELGEEKVFGKTLNETNADLQKNKGKTRTELMISAMKSRLNTTSGDTKEEKLKQNPALFSITPADVLGLSADLQLSDRASLIGLLQDPVLRERMQTVFPQTTDEAEGRIYKPWWSTSPEAIRQRLEAPVGVDRGTDVLLARAAANNVLAPLGRKVADNATAQEAEYNITEGTIESLSKRGKSPDLIQDTVLESQLYGGKAERPLVFSSLKPRFNVTSDEPKLRSLCTMVSQPNAKDEAFALKNAKAVFFEGKILPSGHAVVLTTFVYADLDHMKDTKPTLQVIQQAASTSATANADFQGRGRAIALSSAEFLQQEGTQNMLQKVQDAWEKNRPQREALAKAKAEKEATEASRVQTEQEETMAEAKNIRSKAKENPGTLFKYPEGRWFVGYHKEHGFIYIQPPDSSTASAFTTREASRDKSYTIVEYKDKRYKLDPLYVAKIEQQTGISSDVINQVLVMPIADKPEESVEKVLTVFVKNMHAPDSAKILRSVLGLYKQLQTDGERRAFLSDLRARIYAETRVEGEETKQAEYLSKRTFDVKILPALIKRVASASEERRAA